VSEVVTAVAMPHVPEVSRPHIRITPPGGGAALDLRDLWEYRELIALLVWRDVKVRYKQTLLGAAWIILQPVLTMIVFTFLFGQVMKVPTDGIPYPLFAFGGLLPWMFFSSSVTNSSNSLVGSANLITKVYFPREIIPGAAIGARLVDFAIGFLILFGLLIYYRVALTWAALMIPVLIVLTMLLALGVGMWLSALNVRYRDVGALVPFLIQLGFFVTPIVYPSSLLPQSWQGVIRLNPLTGILEGFRAALLGQKFDWRALGIATAITAVLLVYSAYSFRRMEKDFADVI
jgi:homopolymeric O-antigen transport system permease protein